MNTILGEIGKSPKIKEIIRKNKGAGIDWYNEM